MNRADGLLFTCEEECRLAREPFRPYKPKGEYVVGLGAEQPPAYNDTMREAFYNKQPELRNVPYLLFLSRVHEKKGVDLLLKAYGALATNKAQTALAKTCCRRTQALKLRTEWKCNAWPMIRWG